MGQNMNWLCLRRTLLALKTSCHGGDWSAGNKTNTPLKAQHIWTSTKQLKTAGTIGVGRVAVLESECREWGRHWLSTSTDLRLKERGPAIKRLPIKVGAQLKIDMAGTDADVYVMVGDSLEEILLEVRWKAEQVVGDWTSFTISASETSVCLKQVLNPKSALLEGVRAAMPARWCSLVVEAGKSPVEVQSLKEGNLTVKTFGGNVTLGDLQGGIANIRTNGGHFTADMVSADSVIRTTGGNLLVKRLVGTTIDVDTGGGDVVIGSLYGNDVVIESRGGSVEAKHIQSENTALISTGGGAVHITGVDGNTRILTSGGSVELQLHEHAREVEIDASEGTVTLYFSDNLSAQVEYRGTMDIVQESPLLIPTGEPGRYSFIGKDCWDRLQADNSRASRSEEAAQVSTEFNQGSNMCRIKVVSSGSFHVRQRGWIDVAMASGLPSFVKK